MENLFGYAKYHTNYSKTLYETVSKQDAKLVENYATLESKKLYKLHMQVARHIHLKKSFLRFSSSSHGILYTKTTFEHDILYFVLRFFHSRFPMFHIAIEWKGITHVIDNENRIWKTNMPVAKVVELLEKKLPKNNSLSEAETYEDVWQAYYDSQYIKERRNLNLMNSMMPKKYRGKYYIEDSIRHRSKKLSDFA